MNDERKNVRIIEQTGNQDETIKKENRKALKVYIPILIVSAIVGGIIGFFSATNGIQNFGEACSQTMSHLLYLLSPYGVIVTEAAAVLAGIYYYLTSKKELEHCAPKDAKAAAGEEMEKELNEEMDEETCDRVDLLLSKSMIVVGCGLIISFLFFGIHFAFIERNVEERWMLFTISTAIFVLGSFGYLRLNQLQIDLTKRMNPKMKGSVYDFKFHEKWEESCDEAEKMTIYKAAYKAFRTANSLCSMIWVVLAVGSFLFHFGPLPVVLLSVIWLTMNVAYYRESMRLEHGKINE